MNSDREIALHDYVQSQIGKPFEYGVHDCVTFAAEILDLLTDGDMAETIRGRRKENNELDTYIAKYGTIGEHIASAGGKLVDISHAQTGDFILIEHKPNVISACICLGAKSAVNIDKRGVMLFHTHKIENVREVWHV